MAKSFIERVIALDLRAHKFGYVVFEGSDKLLDWGIKSYRDGDRTQLEGKVAVLRAMFAPSTILIRKVRSNNRVHQQMIDHAVRTIRAFANRILVAIWIIESSSLHRFFSREAKVNKHEVAMMVADRFPELSWRVPSARKPWQTEPRRQSIFDAASLGLFFYAQKAVMKQP